MNRPKPLACGSSMGVSAALTFCAHCGFASTATIKRLHRALHPTSTKRLLERCVAASTPTVFRTRILSCCSPLGWSSPEVVDTRQGSQIMPVLRTDRSRIMIEIAYLSASADAYNERYLACGGETVWIAPGRASFGVKGVVARV